MLPVCLSRVLGCRVWDGPCCSTSGSVSPKEDKFQDTFKGEVPVLVRGKFSVLTTPFISEITRFSRKRTYEGKFSVNKECYP